MPFLAQFEVCKISDNTMCSPEDNPVVQSIDVGAACRLAGGDARLSLDGCRWSNGIPVQFNFALADLALQTVNLGKRDIGVSSTRPFSLGGSRRPYDTFTDPTTRLQFRREGLIFDRDASRPLSEKPNFRLDIVNPAKYGGFKVLDIAGCELVLGASLTLTYKDEAVDLEPMEDSFAYRLPVRTDGRAVDIEQAA